MHQLHQWIDQIGAWYQSQLGHGGYALVALLMAVESSIFPLPSEIVIPPAAHLAHTQGTFSMAGLVVAGTLGSWLGASVMYWLSRLAGRPLVLLYGKLLFITPEKVEGAERWASHHGPMGIFMARLLPVIRHLVGIPAGIVRMNYWSYSLYTLLGSAIWCAVLCWLGVRIGGQINKGQMHHVALSILAVCAVLGVLYYLLVHRHMKASRPPR